MTRPKGIRNNPEALTGLKNELQGLKNIINETHTALAQLDYEMRRDMKLLQTKIIGMESKLHINGLHEAYKLVKPKQRKE
jgi:hypothetical protein